MKNDLTTGAWQHDIGCPISIILFSPSDDTDTKIHGVAIKLTSATKITNAAIWYYCAALSVLLSFVCEGELVVTCASYHRLNSIFS
jgi:hypothetical protein